MPYNIMLAYTCIQLHTLQTRYVRQDWDDMDTGQWHLQRRDGDHYVKRILEAKVQGRRSREGKGRDGWPPHRKTSSHWILH